MERLSYDALNALASGGTAFVEPESVGIFELVEADSQAAVAVIPTAPVNGTLTSTAATVVAAVSSAILPDFFTVTPLASVDTVVKCDQRDLNFYFTGYIENVADGLGGTISRMRIVAHNHGTASHTVAIGQLINYAIFSGVLQDQPRTPNAQLSVVAGFAWLDANGDLLDPLPMVNVDNMNATALPVVSVHDHSITEVELRGHDLGVLGSLYTGRRGIFTVSGNKTVAIGTAVLLGTFTFNPGVATSGITVGQFGATPLFTGYVSSTNGTTIVSIYARNNTFATVIVADGTRLNVFAY